MNKNNKGIRIVNIKEIMYKNKSFCKNYLKEAFEFDRVIKNDVNNNYIESIENTFLIKPILQFFNRLEFSVLSYCFY
jgi:hypothetical protein